MLKLSALLSCIPRLQKMTRDVLKKVGLFVGSLLLLVAVLAAGAGADWIRGGNPSVPYLQDTWWGGYWLSDTSQKRWCLARFYRTRNGELHAIFLAGPNSNEIFDVSENSSHEDFVYLTMKSEMSDAQIEARQLYLGKRYFIGRILAGRLSDFWKENDDVRILGTIERNRVSGEFGVEPIDDTRAELFWHRGVDPGKPRLPLRTILGEIHKIAA